MPSIVTAVFNATIGLIVNKGRDQTAEKMKDGDVIEEKFRGLIVREIDDMKSKLDGLSKKDLLASISFFEEGIELLYEVFHSSARFGSDSDAVTTQTAYAEAYPLAKGKRPSKVIELHESATSTLSIAKKRFKEARREATRAFENEGLETSERILAMQYRVMATILETVDNPAEAVAPCRVSIEELNSLSAVQNGFNAQLKKGLGAVRALFGKDERKKIITSVCHVNRVIYDVTLAVGKDVSFWNWPTVDTGEGKVDPLRDRRVTKVLHKKDLEHCCVTPWTFGQKGEEQRHKLNWPLWIATNSRGQFIVGDPSDSINCDIKVFDSTGTFMKHFNLSFDGVDGYIKLDIQDVAIDTNDNIYVLVNVIESDELFVHVLNSTADFHHKFPVRGPGKYGLAVTDSGKVLVPRNDYSNDYVVIDVYGNDGQFVRTLGKGKMRYVQGIIAVNDDRVLIVDSQDSFVIFTEKSDQYLKEFKLQGGGFPRIAFHRASEHLIAAYNSYLKHCLYVEIYTRDGEFVRSSEIYAREINNDDDIMGLAVTPEGRITVSYIICNCKHCTKGKVIVI